MGVFWQPSAARLGSTLEGEGSERQKGGLPKFQETKKGRLPIFQEDLDKVLFVLLYSTLQKISQFTHICAVHLNKQSIKVQFWQYWKFLGDFEVRAMFRIL